MALKKIALGKSVDVKLYYNKEGAMQYYNKRNHFTEKAIFLTSRASLDVV